MYSVSVVCVLHTPFSCSLQATKPTPPNAPERSAIAPLGHDQNLEGLPFGEQQQDRGTMTALIFQSRWEKIAGCLLAFLISGSRDGSSKEALAFKWNTAYLTIQKLLGSRYDTTTNPSRFAVSMSEHKRQHLFHSNRSARLWGDRTATL